MSAGPRDTDAISARAQASAAIDASPELRGLRDAVAARLDDDPGHDMEHCLRVAGWTVRCGAESDVATAEAIAAALLHDVVNVPKDDPRRAQASALSAQAAAELLPAFGFDEEAAGRICDAIEDHSYSRGATPRSDLGRALQDADRLEALGALGVMRTISTGARMGSRYFHPTDPFAATRELDDRSFSVDHFYTKLLRLPETLRTDVGRAEARRRAAYLEGFLAQLADELGIRA